MGLQDRQKRGFRRFIRSFAYAIEGLKHVIKKEQNMFVHIGFAIITILFAWMLDFPILHWMILLLVIGGMLSLEIMNTAIERTVDLITEEYHPLAKRAKDIAASAVFVFGIFAAIIGIVLFLPPLIEWFQIVFGGV
ncbi:diacylglycerol kinase [Bacillus sp. TS-2]|nr:diacylglycerol kinase [Bacillus sp. TS-2]